ncbi:MAG: O-antigen ligase family protein [Verrucomicrobiota bacterium]
MTGEDGQDSKTSSSAEDRGPVISSNPLWPKLGEWLLALWLASFWFLSWETLHRVLLDLLIVAFLLRTPRAELKRLMQARWLWLAGALLGWQCLSRLWSGGGVESPGWWLDALMVGGLLVTLCGTSRKRMEDRMIPLMALVAAATSAISLLVFYLDGAHNLADDRLRNVFFYTHGLNAVWTGFLMAFGALAGAWLSSQQSGRSRQLSWIGITAVSMFGLLATQSRGPILMFAAGFFVLLVFERKRVLPVIAAGAGVVIVYALLILAHPWRDAASDMIERGSTGRFDIYRWYLTDMSNRDYLIGTGMASSLVVPEGAFDWEVVHPHCIYLTQLYQTGVPGLLLLVSLIAWGLTSAFGLARKGMSVWLCLLFGASVALLFDGSQAFSVYSGTRVEVLLILVPLAISLAGGKGKGGTLTAKPGVS